MRKTFAERLDDAVVFARRTKRLGDLQRYLGLALGGEAGTRLATRIAAPVSADTLLRMAISTGSSESPKERPRILAVNDWARRRGDRYGTILVDLERNQVVDLLADRQAETLATWLREHPGVEVVARDRMAKNAPKGDRQYAVLPWRIGIGGGRDVMLLTSRETGRWVIPKGWPMKGKKPAEAAAQEAYEEAGLIGQIVGKRPIGAYHDTKRTKPSDVLCEVRVYLFLVEKQLEDWPEKQHRVTAWFDATKAAELVDEGALALIIASFAGLSGLVMNRGPGN